MVFCETFGDTPRNRIVEFFLELRETDYGLGDVARNLDMNKATVYTIGHELIKNQFLVPHRHIGKTQTYILNRKHPSVKVLIKTFDMLLRQIGEEEIVKEC